MSNTLYRLYRDDVFTLAETLVMKQQRTADTLNMFLQDRGYSVDWNSQSTWKYFLNLAGFYHKYDKDRIREINIASGLLEVDLDGTPTNLPVGVYADQMLVKKASNAGPVLANFNLALVDPDYSGDVAIANEYEYGTSYYRDLFARYPDFEDLILGILHPIPLSISLTAPDNTILYCGGYYRQQTTTGHLGSRFIYQKKEDIGRNSLLLIEENEQSLINDLQTFIDGFFIRWDVKGYTLSGDLYFPVLLANLYLQIPMFVLNHRLERCLTPEAHSYHVREFLESHGKLAKYIPYLPLKQRLYLYRNVRYIEKNIGKSDTFQMLLDNLATPTGVPLAGYSLVHNLDTMPESLYPTPQSRRKEINFRQVGTGDDVFTIGELLDKEKDLARENARDLDLVTEEVETKVQNSNSDYYPTKVLESAMVNMVDNEPFPFSGFLANLWIYCAAHGDYKGNVFVSNPVTNERLHLTPLSAIILAIYCYNRAHYSEDQFLTTIPVLHVNNIPRSSSYQPTPTHAVFPSLITLKKCIDSNVVSDDMLTDVMAGTGPVYSFTSTAAFFIEAVKMHKLLNDRYKKAVIQEDRDARAQVEYAASQLYWLTVPCTLAPAGTLYEDWLNTNGIGLADIEAVADKRERYKQLGDELVKNATGNFDDETGRLTRLQEAVIEIMRQFSSYSVQYIYDINTKPVVQLDNKTLRLREKSVVFKVKTRLKIPSYRVMNFTASFISKKVTVDIGLVPSIV